MIFETETEVTLVCSLMHLKVSYKQYQDDANPEVGMGWMKSPKQMQQWLGEVLRQNGMSRRAYGEDDTHRFIRILNTICDQEQWRHYVRTFSDRHSTHQPFDDLPENSRFPLINAYGGAVAAQALTRSRNVPSRRPPQSPPAPRPLIEL